MKYTHYREAMPYYSCICICISISLLLVLYLTGCSFLVMPQDVELTSTIVLTTTAESTSLPPAKQLQITYVENHERSGSLYAVDITCISSMKICTGEPVLLFQTLTTPNNAQAEPKGVLTDYSWSPSGKEIVLVSARDLFIGSMTSDTTKWVNITNNPDIDEWEPQWSVDGNFIYYIECLDDPSGMCSPKLVRSDRFGKNKLYLLSKRDTSMTSYVVSPNGQEIIYTETDKQGYEQIYKANLDGTDIQQLTLGEFNNTSPSLSPDGKKVIFVRSNRLHYIDTKPEFGIVLKDLSTGAERNLLENRAGDAFAPVFSPDGKWIVFTLWDENSTSKIIIASSDQMNLMQLTQSNQGAFPAWRVIAR